jgi:hypothetical protein
MITEIWQISTRILSLRSNPFKAHDIHGEILNNESNFQEFSRKNFSARFRVQ